MKIVLLLTTLFSAYGAKYYPSENTHLSRQEFLDMCSQEREFLHQVVTNSVDVLDTIKPDLQNAFMKIFPPHAWCYDVNNALQHIATFFADEPKNVAKLQQIIVLCRLFCLTQQDDEKGHKQCPTFVSSQTPKKRILIGLLGPGLHDTLTLINKLPLASCTILFTSSPYIPPMRRILANCLGRYYIPFPDSLAKMTTFFLPTMSAEGKFFCFFHYNLSQILSNCFFDTTLDGLVPGLKQHYHDTILADIQKHWACDGTEERLYLYYKRSLRQQWPLFWQNPDNPQKTSEGIASSIGVHNWVVDKIDAKSIPNAPLLDQHFAGLLYPFLKNNPINIHNNNRATLHEWHVTLEKDQICSATHIKEFIIAYTRAIHPNISQYALTTLHNTLKDTAPGAESLVLSLDPAPFSPLVIAKSTDPNTFPNTFFLKIPKQSQLPNLDEDEKFHFLNELLIIYNKLSPNSEWEPIVPYSTKGFDNMIELLNIPLETNQEPSTYSVFSLGQSLRRLFV